MPTSDMSNDVKKLDTQSMSREIVETCIKRGVLAEFFRKHETEVINVLTQEFDLEIFGKEQFEEGREEGIAEGIERGIAEGIEKGKAEGKLEMVTAMLKKGLDFAIVAEIAEMPVLEIERLSLAL